MNNTLEFGNFTYAIGRLNAKQQLHVARRLAPFLQTLGMADLKNVMQSAAKLATFAPFAKTLAEMDDDQVDYIVDTCLSVCKRKQDHGWANLLSPDKQLMFSDLTMPAMLRITFEVVRGNLADFFPQVGEATEPKAT